jgi:hypothetical protein
MRRILVDAARARGAHKRGGSVLKVNLDESALLSSIPSRSILALDEALTAFSQVAPRQAKVVELRYFGGLTEEEIVAFHVGPPLPRIVLRRVPRHNGRSLKTLCRTRRRSRLCRSRSEVSTLI